MVICYQSLKTALKIPNPGNFADILEIANIEIQRFKNRQLSVVQVILNPYPWDTVLWGVSEYSGFLEYPEFRDFRSNQKSKITKRIPNYILPLLKNKIFFSTL